MKNFLFTTTQLLDGYRVKSYLDSINVNIVIGTNFFSDFAASFTDVFGGFSDTYQGKMNQMYDKAKNEMKKKAKLLGANAILGFKIDFDELSGKGKSMFMLSATGTACIVENLEQKEQGETSHKYVDSQQLSVLIRKEALIQKINDCSDRFIEYNEFEDEDWNFMMEHPSLDIIEPLVRILYYRDSFTGKIEALVNQLDYEEACNIVYPLYSKPYVLDYLFGTSNDEVSRKYAKLIKNCRLFKPDAVKALIEKDLEKAVEILDCDKPFYTSEDLSVMQEICTLLENLPDKGQIILGKSGMFSKEKELFVCENGHKNDKEQEFCETCGLNIKGLKFYQVVLITEFSNKVEALKKLLKE